MNLEQKIGVICFLIGFVIGVASLAVYLAVPMTSAWAIIPVIAAALCAGILIGIFALFLAICTVARPNAKASDY